MEVSLVAQTRRMLLELLVAALEHLDLLSKEGQVVLKLFL